MSFLRLIVGQPIHSLEASVPANDATKSQRTYWRIDAKLIRLLCNQFDESPWARSKSMKAASKKANEILLGWRKEVTLLATRRE